MFDIQLFGNNDTVTSSREGKLVVSFYDSDDRTITIDNPRTDLTATDINNLVTLMSATQPIIGDKTGASVVGAESFKIYEKEVRILDLT